MSTVRNRIASVLTILAIAMSALVVGAPAANAAAYVAPKPTCNTWFNNLPSWVPDPAGERAKCRAKTMWELLDASANQMRRENNAAVRSKVNYKYYWALAGPLSYGGNSYLWKEGFKTSSSQAGNAASSKEASYKFLISLRNYVARNSRNYAQMNSSVMTLNVINQMTIGKNLPKQAPAVTKWVVKNGFKFSDVQTPTQVLAAAAIPLVRDSYLDGARVDLFRSVWE